MLKLGMLLNEEEQLDNNFNSFCEFWINNFHFELFYDLSKLVYNSATPQEDEYEESNDDCDIHTLPTEILSHVFTFLTPVELLAVRGVCRKWQAIFESDQSLWNHVSFSAIDLDVKTTASLIKEMPLLRTIYLCNVNTPDDMSYLIDALCHACWDLHSIHFPDSCNCYPSSQDLHQLSYYHPCIKSLTLATKKKLTSTDLSNIGKVLSNFSCLRDLKLVGYYWHQKELFEEVLPNVGHLHSISLPSFPGISNCELKQLAQVLPHLKTATINTSAILGAHLSNQFLNQLQTLKIIDKSSLTAEKLAALSELSSLKSLDINLSNSSKVHVLAFFSKLRNKMEELTVSNCEFSIDLLRALPASCPRLRVLIWLNPKDVAGEVTDEGVLAVSQLPLLAHLEIKSRSVSRAYYNNLAAIKSLKYVRINGMRITGCL